MSEEHIRTSCRSFYKVLSDYLDGELCTEDMEHVRGHIAACPPCGVYLNQFQIVYRNTGTVTAEDLPDDFCQVMDKVLAKWKCGGDDSA